MLDGNIHSTRRLDGIVEVVAQTSTIDTNNERADADLECTTTFDRTQTRTVTFRRPSDAFAGDR